MDDLAVQVETAGSVFGCRYSTSEEYEAELIALRRRLGLYAMPRRPRAGLWLASALAVIALMLAATL